MTDVILLAHRVIGFYFDDVTDNTAFPSVRQFNVLDRNNNIDCLSDEFLHITGCAVFLCK